MRRVVLQPEAQDDLRAILAYIAQDNFNSANRVVDRLERASMELGEAALRYPVLSRYQHSGIRRRVVGSYNIFFRANPTLSIFYVSSTQRAMRINSSPTTRAFFVLMESERKL